MIKSAETDKAKEATQESAASPVYPDLKNKKILITGATRGIGRGIALALAQQKAHCLFNYRGDSTKAMQLKDEIESLGGQATPLPFDLTDTAQMQSVVDAYVKEHGPISGLVNNAGISKDQIVLRIKEEEVSSILDTNLKGTIMMTVALSRNFLKADRVSIVNISSVVGLMRNASQIAYAASKAGIIGFAKSYAKELASRNVRCNTICPGFIETEMTEKLSAEAKGKYLAQIPLQRFGQIVEVANLTCFLLSQASSYITGEIIKVDGGLYI